MDARFGCAWVGAKVDRQVGDTQMRPSQFSFNDALRVDFQGARVTSDGGLILARELDERLGFGELVDRHLSDSRRGKNIQLPLPDLLRPSIHSRLADYCRRRRRRAPLSGSDSPAHRAENTTRICRSPGAAHGTRITRVPFPGNISIPAPPPHCARDQTKRRA